MAFERSVFKGLSRNLNYMTALKPGPLIAYIDPTR